jgi:hypothetical protein
MAIGTAARSLTLALTLAMFSSFVAAQGQTGTIAGVVKDATGAVLPGVTVEAASPALIEKVRSVVTDGQGAYKIVDLRPGEYSVTFTLTGFTTVKREGIELTTSFTANVNAELKVGAVAETITVSGETPVVDVQNVLRKTTASREVMDALPTDRNFVSFAAMQPGVFVTGVSQNVGGSVPETGMNLVVHGSRAADSLIMVDGMPIINGSGQGGLQYGNYLNNAMAQEITFQTDGHNAEFERASVYSNFIPKEGSNTHRFFFVGRFTNESLEATNLDQDQINQGLKSGSRIDKIWDINPNYGGPLIKDKMWIFLGYRHWGTYNTVAGSFKDADFNAFYYKPSTEQNLFPVWHQSAAARLTTQVSQKNKVNLHYDWQYTFFGNCFVPSYLTAISACPQYKNIPQYIVQGTWSAPVTNKLLLEAGATLTAQDFHGYPQTGIPATQFSVNDPLAPAGMPQTWGSANGVNAIYGANRSDQSNYRASASYVTGSHNIKVGLTLMHQWRLVTTEVNNSVTLSLRNTPACQAAGIECGQPFSLTQFATPIQYQEHVNYNMGIFAQDQWTYKRLTANYGVRLDFLNSSVDAQQLPPGPFTAARNFEAVPNAPNWKDVDPRFGAAYDLFGNGKTALKASFGRYVVADAYTIARALNPVQSSVNTVTRPWADPSGTLNPFNDCNLNNPAQNGGCGPISNPAFGNVVARTTNYDPSIVQGWGVRPANWESQFSVQQQIVPRVSGYAAYTRRSYANLFATKNVAVTNASFTSFCLNTPVDSRLPNSGQQQCGYYDLTPAGRLITPNNIVQSSNNFGGIEDVYDGFDFDANARLGRGIVLSGGVSFGRERTNSCNLANDLSLVFQSGVGALIGSGLVIQAPRTAAYCDVHPPLQPNAKAQLSYPIWWGVNFALSWQSLPGLQINAQYPLSNTTPGLTLGRSFSSTPPTVDILAPGTQYLPRIYQTDLRFSKTIKAGNKVIRPNVSVYNLFNSNATNTFNSYTQTFGSAWQAPTVILTPRFVDFGVQVDF